MPFTSNRLIVSAIAVALLMGCTHLKPEQRQPELARPAAAEPLWEQLDQTRSGEWFHLLNTPDEALDWRLRVLDSATDSIDVETFLRKPDETGLTLLAHLIAAAERGVRVRVLLDDSFTMHEELFLRAMDTHPNIDLRIYNPFVRRPGGVLMRQLLNLAEFSRLDHRMHNKALVADGRVAIIGGRNLADEYFGGHASFNFRDLEVILYAGSVGAIEDHFDSYWNSGWAFPVRELSAPKPEPKGFPDLQEHLEDRGVRAKVPAENLPELWTLLARTAHDGTAHFYADEPARLDPAAEDEAPNQLAQRLLMAIDSARSDLILVSAYLIPTPNLEAAIGRAEARGVRVRILTNSLQSNNHLAAHAAYRHHLHALLGQGVELHEVRAHALDRGRYMAPPVEGKLLGLHAKLMVVDRDAVFIGSANLDPRSLRLNTEVGLLIRSEGLTQAVLDSIEPDFHPDNSWAVEQMEDGTLRWVAGEVVMTEQPADSPVTRLEDWFLGLLPIDSEM